MTSRRPGFTKIDTGDHNFENLPSDYCLCSIEATFVLFPIMGHLPYIPERKVLGHCGSHMMQS